MTGQAGPDEALVDDFPSAIQPHGMLFCVTHDLRILQVSENTSRFLGVAASDLLGVSLNTLLSAEQLGYLTTCLDLDKSQVVVPIVLQLRSKLEHPLSVICFARRYNDFYILEFETEVSESVEQAVQANLLPESFASLVSDLQSQTELTDCSQSAAARVKELIGYDRVLVCKYDSDWQAVVVAEVKAEALEPFLGLRYSACDLSELSVLEQNQYMSKPLRLINDVDCALVPLLPVCNPVTKKPLDTSDCILHVASPRDIDYLQSLGVRAALTISLLVRGKLWGLIVCHHSSIKFLSLSRRASCEMLGQLLALRLVGLVDTDSQRQAVGDKAMLESVSNGQLLERQRESFDETLLQQREELLAALTHDLKNPISGTIQLLEYLQTGRLGSTIFELRETFSEIIRAQRMLLQRLTSFLVSHKYDNPALLVERCDFELRAVIDSAVSISRMSSAVAGVSLSVVVPLEVRVLGDSDALCRVIENLLGNAIKFSPADSIVRLLVEQDDEVVTFTVQDAGPGVSVTDMPYLFDRYWQGEVGRRVAFGSGLGLYSCKKIIEAHKGRIWCESTVGEGAKFYVQLPKSAA